MQDHYSRLQNVGKWSQTIDAEIPSSLGFGVGGRSYSNFLVSTVLEAPGLAVSRLTGTTAVVIVTTSHLQLPRHYSAYGWLKLSHARSVSRARMHLARWARTCLGLAFICCLGLEIEASAMVRYEA